MSSFSNTTHLNTIPQLSLQQRISNISNIRCTSKSITLSMTKLTTVDAACLSPLAQPYPKRTNNNKNIKNVLDKLKEENNHKKTLNLGLSSTEIADFAAHGFTNVSKICNTLQGAIYKAESIKNGMVTIKKTVKSFHNKKVSIPDETGMTMIMDQDIIKEALILHHLTVDNKSISNNIVKFVSFWQNRSNYYLVTEYDEKEITMQKFNQKAHEYIKNGRLNVKDWKRICRYIFWQLTVIVNYLHNDMNCCHLDLSTKNILLFGADFIINEKTGMVSINPNVRVRLTDFGLSEIFKVSKNDVDDKEKEEEHYHYGINGGFQCYKHGISDRHHLKSPQIFNNEQYDARKADVWSLGVILFESLLGFEPFKTQNWRADYGYWALEKKKLVEFFEYKNSKKYVNRKIADFLHDILETDESKRLDITDVIHSKWLESYHTKYGDALLKKSASQKKRNLTVHKKKMQQFPYYKF